MIKSTLLFLFISVVFFSNAQTDSMLFNHSIALERLKNSEDELFVKILDEYNDYLNSNPTNLDVLIERLQFVDYAQFDEYEEINPNQELSDSLLLHLLSIYPQSPQVILYQAEYAWGDSLKNIFLKAEELIRKNNDWSSEQKGKLYSHIANTHYYNDEFSEAALYARKALKADSSYVKNITYCNILLKNKDSVLLKETILANIDSTESSWTLKRKADILIELNQYDEALELYNLVQAKDSSVVQNDKMASIFEGVGQYNLARTYYLKDTSNTWDKSDAILNLFKHDLNYQTADLSSQSYNAYRDIGFTQDPLGVYRIHLLVHHPSAGWKLRDIGGILLLLLIVALFILLPSIWVLPVYFIGHHYKIKPDFNLGFGWGLKAFWFVSAAYWLASLFCLFPTPEDINYYFNDTNYYTEENNQLALSTLLFILFLGIVSLLTLFRKKINVLGASLLPYRKTFFMTLGYFLLFKIATGIYVSIGTKLFGIDMLNTISSIDLMLSSKPEIISLIESYNLLLTLLLVAVFVPIYEEVIFRGVILEAATNYITYKWANILQAFLFASVHGELYLSPVFFAFGIIAGNLRKKTGGLFGGILFHIVNNFLAVIAIYGKMNLNLKALIF